MADNKKYYYIKLKENFFESDEMIILENMPDGYLYSNILIKLYLKSLKNEGCLMFRGVIPYTPNILAQITRHNIGIVEKALKVFSDIGLIDILDNGSIYMLDIQELIGESSTETDRKRNYRNKIHQKKLSDGTNDGTFSGTNDRTFSGIFDGQMSPRDRDKDKDKDRDKDKDKDRDIVCGSCCDENIKKIGDMFLSEGFGPVTSIIVDQLIGLNEEYTAEWVEAAMKRAVSANKRSLNYVHGILKNWKAEGGINNESSGGYRNDYRKDPEEHTEDYRLPTNRDQGRDLTEEELKRIVMSKV